jgi:chromosome segregation ATPase
VKFKKSYDTALANHGEEITKLKGSHESSIADLRGQIEQLTAAQAAAGAAQEDSSSAALAALQKECDELKATNSTLQGEVQSYKEKAQATEEEKTKFVTENEARQDEFCKIVLLQQTLQKQDTEKLHQKALAAKDEALAALQKLTDECMEKIKALEAREPAAQAPAEANPVAELPVASETVTTTDAGATDVEACGNNGAAAKALEAQLETLRQEATGLRAKLAAVEEQHSSERSALQARVDEAEATVKDLTEGSAGAEAVGRLRAQLESVREDLRRRVEDLQAELKGKEDELCYTVEQLSTSAGACDDLRSRCTSLESALAACEKRAVRAEVCSSLMV